MVKIEELITELDAKATELRSLMEDAAKRLKSAPPGFLKRKKKRGAERFYLVADREYSKNEYLGKDKKQLKAQLSRKKYDALLLRVLEPQLEAIIDCRNRLEKVEDKRDFRQVLEDMDSELRALVEYTFDDEDERYARQWQSKDFGRWPNRSQTYTSLRGDRLRSKSEVLIADRLFSKGVPYHYETVFELYDGTHVNLDFRILNKRTRKEFLWEHLGMMDDSQYCANCIGKIEKYSKSGVVLGRNLIITMESSLRPMSTWVIDEIIHEYLL